MMMNVVCDYLKVKNYDDILQNKHALSLFHKFSVKQKIAHVHWEVL